MWGVNDLAVRKVSLKKPFRFLIWGLGSIYNRLLNTIRFYEQQGTIEIAGIVARDRYQFAYLDGYPVYDLSAIKGLEYDYIVVMSEKSYKQIVNCGEELGVRSSLFVSSRMFEIPNLNVERYLLLREKNISVISNNCWGGIACRALGLECRGPFRNLFLRDEDYLRCINDLNTYCTMTPTYKRDEIDPNSDKQYPVLGINDIEIHCNHADSVEEAIEEWNRRCKKINYEELFFEMYTVDRKVAEAFSVLPFNKICFVPAGTGLGDIAGTQEIKVQGKQSHFWEAVNDAGSVAGFEYDLVELLLTGTVKRRNKN